MRDLLRQHKGPAAVTAALPAAFADAQARREQAEAELRELSELNALADRELNRDRKDVDRSGETIQAHLDAHRAIREAK